MSQIIYTLSRILFATILLSLTTGCARRTIPMEDYVRPIVTSKSTQGVVYLTASGYARRKGDAKQEALRRAIEEVMFRGIPNSNVKRPLINEPGARAKHERYFKRFFSDGGPYTDYGKILNINPFQTIRYKRGYQVFVDVEVNYAQLQRDLERAGIISKFGI